MDFHEISYLSIFRKSVWKIHLLLKASKNNGHFAWRPMYVCDNIFLNSSQKRNISKKKFAEKIKTHILCSKTFSKNLTVYEIMWKNMVQSWQATDYNIVRRRNDAICVLDNSGCRHTLRIYNIYCFATATMVTQKRLNINYTYVYCLIYQWLKFLFSDTRGS
jgi:hypothetical protein